MMETWILIGGAWLGSWVLISILFFIWANLSTRLLKRRYKEENDRGRKIEEFGERGGIDKGAIRRAVEGIARTEETSTITPTTSPNPTTNPITTIEQGARTHRGESEIDRTNLSDGQEFNEPTDNSFPTGNVKSSEGNFKEPTPSRELSFSERRWRKD